MTKDILPPSTIQFQFRDAARDVCRRPAGAYDALKNPAPVSHAPAASRLSQTSSPLSNTSNVKRSDRSLSDSVKRSTSSAQVKPSVRPLVVRPEACELKLGRERPHRLMARFSEAEKECVLRKAKTARLSVNEYIRASVLGAGYVSSVDPARQKLLHDLSVELGRQGTNLNQIAHRLNAGMVGTQQGEGLLAELYDSLLDAHDAVRRALTEGKVYE